MIILAVVSCPAVMAQSADSEQGAQPPTAPNGNATNQRWNIHFQATSIAQHHWSFPSKYEGVNSLPSHPETRVSLTATAYLIMRLSRHVEIVINPELAGGKGFGGVTGIAGFTNGEIPRVAQAAPRPYLARGYLDFTWGIGKDTEPSESGANQLAGVRAQKRFRVIVGKFALTDYFDDNTYSHDPRTQFMNWAIMYNGAWDYPSDTRGYSVGTIQELVMRSWSLRLASVMEPTEANGPTFDTRVSKNRGEALEWELRYKPRSRLGKVRVLGYLNREDAGTFREALVAGGVPDLGPTRRPGTRKYGFCLNLEQALTSDVGLFGRYGWADGKTEAWTFTQIDRTISGGISVNGNRWKRPLDVVGVGAARNYLSGDQRAFLAGGGVGFIIGDGTLTYAPESIVEVYYAFRVAKCWTIASGYQHIQNPAYNRDRGPVSVASVRLHWER